MGQLEWNQIMKDCILGNDFKPQRVTESFAHWVNVDLFATQKIAQAMGYMVVQEEREKVSEKAASITRPSSKPAGLPLLDVPCPWIWGQAGRKEEAVISSVSPSYRKHAGPFLGGLSLMLRGGAPVLTDGALPIQLPLAVSVTCGTNKSPKCMHTEGSQYIKM